MNKRAKKKKEKQRRLYEESRKGGFEKLGAVISDAIFSTMSRPSRLTGTDEEWLEWDNSQHPHWTRTSWGGKTQSILKFTPIEEDNAPLDNPK